MKTDLSRDAIGLPDVARIFEVTYRHALRQVKKAGFPTPVQTDPNRLWSRAEVIQWATDEGYWDPITERRLRSRLAKSARYLDDRIRRETMRAGAA